MAQKDYYGIAVKLITNATQLPFVKVDRTTFLAEQFKDNPNLNLILEKGPLAVFTPDELYKIAQRIIANTTKKTTSLSFLSGIPSNPVTALASGTGDLVQYYGFALNLAQQIAYLFGEPSLFNATYTEEDELKIMTYLGVMLGVSGAVGLLSKITEHMSKHLGKSIANKTLTKTIWYPIIKKIGSVIGLKITKKTVEKSVSKIVPFVGAVASSGLTYFTFKPMGERLANTFRDIAKGKIDISIEEINLQLDDSIDAEFEEI